jgi:hypothetical protein
MIQVVLPFLQKWWKELTILVLCIALGVLYKYKSPPQVVTKVETVEVIKEVVKKEVEVQTKIEYRTQKQIVTRTITKTADGKEVTNERVETESQEKANTNNKKESASVSTEKASIKQSVETRPASKDYFLGIDVPINHRSVRLGLGTRLFGPIIGTMGTSIDYKQPLKQLPNFSIGIMYEF